MSMLPLPSCTLPPLTAVVSITRVFLELRAVRGLGLVHALVRKLHQVPFFGVAPHRSDPCRTMHCSHCCQDLRLDARAQPLEEKLGLPLGGLGQDKKELVPAIADDLVDGPQRLPQYCHQRLEDPVAFGVTQPVVDGLELVDIQHDKRQVMTVPPSPFQLLRNDAAHGVTVVCSCKAVQQGLFAQELLDLHACEHQADTSHQGRQVPDILAGERAGFLAFEVQDTDHLTSHHQWESQVRAPTRYGAQVERTGTHLSLIHISEPTRLGMSSYAVFCLKKKKKKKTH